MEKLLNRKDAAALLGISVATLDILKSSGPISYVQYVPRGAVYFTETCLQEYVARCTHRARPTEKIETYRKRRTPKN